MTTKRKIIWTFGNILILFGMLLMLFVGGLLADEQYNVYAASGDNDVVAPVLTAPTAAPAAPNEPTAQPSVPRAPSRFNIPVLNTGGASELTNAVPTAANAGGPSTITRMVVPQIGLDKKVLEVGWTVQNIDGQEVAIWDVDKYRVGHHQGTSNPGEGGNIVLAGHSGGKAYPFNDIFYLKPGDLIELYSNNQVFDYHVSDHILVDEVGQPIEKRLENARYIEPTGEEVVTMVACWPLTGPNKFNQRIIIRAKPVNAQPPVEQAQQEYSGWTAR
jgi:LPXTG-site transpeptidase (sortase) family protein